MIKIVMYEDNRRYRESIQSYFEDAEDIKIAVAYNDANDAAAQVLRHKPDLVLMDIEMPGITGLEALVAVKQARPETKVMMLTSFHDEERIFKAICNGASGYMLKGDSMLSIETAIYEIHEGGGYLTPSIALKVMGMLRNPTSKPDLGYDVKLSPRQIQVLEKMVECKTRKVIAEELNVGYETVSQHIKTIYEKLHVNSSTEAVKIAILKGIVKG